MQTQQIFLQHIIEAIELIGQYTNGKSFGDFEDDKELQDAVLRRLEIIGEAVKNLPDDFKARHADVEWKQAMAMRDVHFALAKCIRHRLASRC